MTVAAISQPSAPRRLRAWLIGGFKTHDTSGDDDPGYRWSLVWFRWGVTAAYLFIAFVVRPGQDPVWAAAAGAFIVAMHIATTVHTRIHTRRGRPVVWFYEAQPFLDIIAVSLVMASVPGIAFPVWGVYILIIFGASVAHGNSFVALLTLSCIAGYGLAIGAHLASGLEVSWSTVASVVIVLLLAGWYASTRAAFEVSVVRRLAGSERRMRLLHGLTHALLHSETIQNVYETTLDCLPEALRAERSSILIFDPDGVMRFKAWRVLSDTYRAAVEGHSPWAPDDVDPQPILMPDVLREPGLEELLPVIQSEGIRALAFIPLSHDGHLFGKFMVYYDTPHQFTDEEVELATTIANHVAIAHHRLDMAEALRASEARYRSVIGSAPIVLFAVDEKGVFVLSEGQGLSGTGRTSDGAVGKSIFSRYAEYPEAVEVFKRALAGESGNITLEVRGRWWETSYAPRYNGERAITGVTGVAFDVTERKHAEDALRENQDRLGLLNGIARRVAAGTSAEETINASVEQLAAYFPDLRVAYSTIAEDFTLTVVRSLQPDGVVDLTGMNARLGHGSASLKSLRAMEALVVSDVTLDPVVADIADTLVDLGARAILDVPVHHSENLVGLLSFDSPEVREWSDHELAILNDVADYLSMVIKEAHAQEDRRIAEEAARHMAFHDPLTGLPNRRLLEERFTDALSRARRSRTSIGVISADLDRFKSVNDTVGHAIGDELLRTVAQRLLALVRDTDTVARVGGDEFVILLTGIDSAEAAMAVGERMLEKLREPVEVGGYRVHVTASLGVSIYPSDGREAEALLRNADVAMYRAKEIGKDAIHQFDTEMKWNDFRRGVMGGDLRQAMERDEFTVFYQPIGDIRTGRLSGVEALLRWQHPERGLVLPGEFIDVAEETGLIVPLGDWALRTACTQVQSWRAESLTAVRVAVNLSARQFLQADLVAMVQSALTDSGLPAGLLEIEITESLAMADDALTMRVLSSFKSMGVRIAIDDFGTGHSSLSRLKNFPIDTLKIDRLFVQGAPKDQRDAAIVQATVAMGHSLGLNVIAEGVEEPAQLDFVTDLECDEVQGFLLGRPAPPSELRKKLVKYGGDGAPKNGKTSNGRAANGKSTNDRARAPRA